MILHDYSQVYGYLVTCWQTCALLMSSHLLQLDSKTESELKEENEEDYAMNSECYLEVSIYLEAFERIP